MISTQKHIIHKVIVDVETKNEGAAFQLKDTIDMFLKEEIFPSLEQYFESLEDEFQTQTIQISKLHFNVNSTSENDFKELKEEIKKEAFKELKKVIKSPKKESENVAFLSAAKSDERALVYFLEKGTPPWWNGSDKVDFLKGKKLIEISRSTSFMKLFREKITKENVQNRFINQFLDEEIQILLGNVFHTHAVKKSIVNDEIIEKFEALSPNIRKSIWKIFIDFLLTKNEEIFLEKLVELFRLEKRNKGQKNRIKILMKIIELVSNKFDKKTSKKIALEYLNSEQNPLKKNDENTIGFDSQKSIENNEEKRTESNAETNTRNDAEINDRKIGKPKENIKINRDEKVVVNEVFHDDCAIESIAVADDLENVKIKSSHADDEAFYTGNMDVELDKNVKKFDDSLSKSEYGIQHEKEHRKIVKKELKTDKISKRNKAPFQDEKSIGNTSNLPSESEKEKQHKKVVSKELKTDGISERKKMHFEEDENVKNTNDLLPKSEKEQQQNKSTFEELKNIESIQETSKESTSKIDVKSDKKDQQESVAEFLKEEIYPEEKGEYYIQNAGLVLLHPYLKDFFFNCNLLNDDSKIINPELAIHLLHYIATKKEKQFEDNMVFEKFLCGVPIQKTIRRNIEISEELKQKSEDLLKAVITNWGSLNDASPDLLRNEFLQRSGKISFKETNPKIVVERKMYDILLDKIPWTLSLCKLPWISKLIYTDW